MNLKLEAPLIQVQVQVQVPTSVAKYNFFGELELEVRSAWGLIIANS